MILQPRDVGWIEVICGPMFSGKTEELIRRLKRASYARQSVQIFKPAIDDRYDESAIVSHSQISLPSVAVKNLDELRHALDPQVDVVGIDEVQFFDERVIDFCEELADGGRRVVVAGLDQDYRGQPFGPMPGLLSVAEYITKLMSICMRCGNPAHRSYRLSEDPQQVLVGTAQQYEARCRRCFTEGYPSQSAAASKPAEHQRMEPRGRR
ncbi:thymidine kinase [Bradymonadaceae bacterium TMQ3]|uniref:Thymidine kinase n=1 Tax=Lujinxingia sediminis TaxID=2480984 RepID=A0ABY0CXX7_9DELT|nr:thymidine kinase [Lujinxingia sediminis]RDV39228.1 thymidine kinase [Bradymonadaceae bacterium TMQ3]RVU48732.1 thymidine kinase [Lujinxingia sediminis]TXC78025.1 thymidine kinase [Bradymonadales bacterium TMQ1]